MSWVPTWGTGADSCGGSGTCGGAGLDMPFPIWASVAPGAEGEIRGSELTFLVSSGSELLGKGTLQ